MYTTNDLQAEILRLKKENDVCILAHTYQTQDILEVADLGVNYISSGALTHSSPILDLSLKNLHAV